MSGRQSVELNKGSYDIVQEIGIGASSKVYLVQRNPSHLMQLPTQSTNIKHPDSAPLTPIQDVNPDLARFEELIIQNRKDSLIETPLPNYDYSSFLIENGRQHSYIAHNTEKEEENDRTREFFALKVVTIQSEAPEQRKKEKDYWREVQMLNRLHHPGIVQILDQGVSSRQGKRELYLLTQWGSGGNFHRFLDTVTETSLPLQAIQSIYKYCIIQIVEIIDYLQNIGVSHLDLKVILDQKKAENFILDEKYRLKLIDFGTAQEAEGEGEIERGYKGTKEYISPEMINRSRHLQTLQHYSKADVWSLGNYSIDAGVLIYYIYTRRYPFLNINTFSAVTEIKNSEPDLSHLTNPHLRPLIASMLRKNPAERIGIREVKLNPYFQGINFSTAFAHESPFLSLIREQGQETMFRQELLVRINGKTKKRVISLTRKSPPARLPKQELLFDRMTSLSNIDIKKNASQHMEGHSHNRIQSSASLDPPSVQYYLTIGRIGATAQPKLMEVLQSTTISPSKNACQVEWKEIKDIIYENYPKLVELTFTSQEVLQAFVSCFQRMKKEMG